MLTDCLCLQVGGCCGCGPEGIAAAARRIDVLRDAKKDFKPKPGAFAAAGKPKLKESLAQKQGYKTS